MKSNIRKLIVYILLFLLALTTIVPMLWTFSTSLKSKQATLAFPPDIVPKEPTLNNYITLFNAYPFGRYLFNSVLVTSATVFLQVLIAGLAAFAFARFDFRFKNTLFVLYLATLMIPFQVTAIPLYLIVRNLNWINTYQGLIVPKLFSAFGVFLLRQAFMSTPREFDESAFMDGAGYFTVFFKIVLPMNKTALATFGIFSFMDAWNSYLWPLIVSTEQNMMTLPVGLANLHGRWITQWNLVSAGAMISIIPILLVFLFAQKWFVQGVASSGLKG